MRPRADKNFTKVSPLQIYSFSSLKFWPPAKQTHLSAVNLASKRNQKFRFLRSKYCLCKCSHGNQNLPSYHLIKNLVRAKSKIYKDRQIKSKTLIAYHQKSKILISSILKQLFNLYKPKIIKVRQSML